MARKPDTLCSGGCGRLLWSGTTSLPAAERRCRACRRAAWVCVRCGDSTSGLDWSPPSNRRSLCRACSEKRVDSDQRKARRRLKRRQRNTWASLADPGVPAPQYGSTALAVDVQPDGVLIGVAWLADDGRVMVMASRLEEDQAQSAGRLLAKMVQVHAPADVSLHVSQHESERAVEKFQRLVECRRVGHLDQDELCGGPWERYRGDVFGAVAVAAARVVDSI